MNTLSHDNQKDVAIIGGGPIGLEVAWALGREGIDYVQFEAGGVLAVAEAYDAMTSSLLREPLTPEYALERLQSRKGAAYEQDCVEALTDQLKPRAVCIPLSD